MSYYNIIAKVVVKEGGAEAMSDQLTHTSSLDHSVKDIFNLLRGGKYANMTKHMTCYAGAAPCTFAPSSMTEITAPASFAVSELSAFNYKALLFDVNAPGDAKKASEAPKPSLYAQMMCGPKAKLPEKYTKYVDPKDAAGGTAKAAKASKGSTEKTPTKLTSAHLAYNHISRALFIRRGG